MANAPSKLRMFVACELPDELIEALRRVQSDLRRHTGDGLRWVRPEGIHLTLKFLGDVEMTRLEEVKTALAGAIRPFSVSLRPSRLGGFGGRRLRVVWVGLDGDVDGLSELAESIVAVLAPLGFPSEDRPFRPHLTLARVPDRVANEERHQLSALVEAHQLPDLPVAVVSQVSLIQSTLGPGGAKYRTISTYPG